MENNKTEKQSFIERLAANETYRTLVYIALAMLILFAMAHNVIYFADTAIDLANSTATVLQVARALFSFFVMSLFFIVIGIQAVAYFFKNHLNINVTVNKDSE